MPNSLHSIQIHSVQHRARNPLKFKQLKTGTFELSPKSALGTVDRMIVFNHLQVGHLHKQQVVARDEPHPCCTPAIPLWNSHPQFRLHYREAFFAIATIPLILS
jgi:hypothetical protein